jgi:predicted nucleotidyltransferase
MTTRHAPHKPATLATRRSRAAAVSKLLHSAGHRPMPSGSSRMGLLQVRGCSDAVSIMINLDYHPRRVNEQLEGELIELLVGSGYEVQRVHRDMRAQGIWIHVVRTTW